MYIFLIRGCVWLSLKDWAAWKQSDPEADARKSSFEEQLNAQLAELDAKIAAESDPKKKAKLEAEKATKEQWLNAIK